LNDPTRPPPAENRLVFPLNFPYVCPEPVLAKQSCLVDYETGAKKGIFHTRVEGDAVLIEAVQRCEQPAKNGIFEPFVYKNDPFAKTGSGQTQGKLKKDAVFRTGLLRRKVRRSRSQATRRAHAATLGDRGRGKIERLSRYAKHTNASHFEYFSDVRPEPVLVNRSLFSI
jgi:hypothetical protein